MRILSYNIWNYSASWRRRRRLLLDIMRRERPDLVALQEVRHNWNDPPGHNQGRWLARRSGYEYIYRPASLMWPVPPVVEGLAVLSRSPITSWAAYRLPQLPASGPRRIVLVARLADLDVYVVHLGLSERLRLLQAQALSDLVRTISSPAIVGTSSGGDVPEGSTTETTARNLRYASKDVARVGYRGGPSPPRPPSPTGGEGGDTARRASRDSRPRPRGSERCPKCEPGISASPAVVVGDFNADPPTAPMTVLRQAGFVDLWEYFHPGDPGFTGPPAHPFRRLDYALGYGRSDWSGSIRLVGLDADTHGRFPSDHAGILLDLD